jgi:hypothetical protein
MTKQQQKMKFISVIYIKYCGFDNLFYGKPVVELFKASYYLTATYVQEQYDGEKD